MSKSNVVKSFFKSFIKRIDIFYLKVVCSVERALSKNLDSALNRRVLKKYDTAEKRLSVIKSRWKFVPSINFISLEPLSRNTLRIDLNETIKTFLLSDENFIGLYHKYNISFIKTFDLFHFQSTSLGVKAFESIFKTLSNPNALIRFKYRIESEGDRIPLNWRSLQAENESMDRGEDGLTPSEREFSRTEHIGGLHMIPIITSFPLNMHSELFLEIWYSVTPLEIQKEVSRWVESYSMPIDHIILSGITTLVEKHFEDPENNESVLENPPSWTVALMDA